MSRPKKSDMNPIPTKERLYQKALELFSRKGFDAVSVRMITRSLDLNEATLYIHYKNKSALLDEILDRFEAKLITPGLKQPSLEYFQSLESFDLHAFLMEGAKRFFTRADREVLMTWRMLMISQYTFPVARVSIENHLLDTPVDHFISMFTTMAAAGLIRQDVDCEALGRLVGSLFFDYSFRANLKGAWGEVQDQDMQHLSQQIQVLARLLAE